MPTTRKKKGKPANNDKNNNTNTNGDESEDTNQPAVDTSTIDKDEGDSINNNTKVPDNSEKNDHDNSPILPKDPTKKRKQLRFEDSEDDDFGGDGRRTLTTRPELTLKRVYHGGTDLNGFEREFWRIAEANRWPRNVQVAMLCENLAGLAKPFVETVLDEAVDVVSARDLFVLMRMEFMKQSALALSQAQVDDMRQGENESIKVYAARFTKALKASGQSDSGVTAIKFYRSTKAVGILPFNSKTFVSVRAVADAINDWEQSKAWAKTGKLVRTEGYPTIPRDDSLEIDEQGYEERPQTRRRLAVDDDGPRVQAVHFRGDSVSGSSQQSLDPRIPSWNKAEMQGPQGNTMKMQDAAVVPKLPSNFHDAVCQLCAMPGHTALECGQFLQARRPRLQCSICSRLGHSADQCRSSLQCSFCGKMGHDGMMCFANPSGQAYRGRGRGARGSDSRGRGRGSVRDGYFGQMRQDTDRRCYECGESGHLARDCTQPLPRRDQHGGGASSQPTRSHQGDDVSLSQVQMARWARTIVREVKMEDDRNAGRVKGQDGGNIVPPPGDQEN